VLGVIYVVARVRRRAAAAVPRDEVHHILYVDGDRNPSVKNSPAVTVAKE